MITLNRNRTKPTINDVLNELDAFEAETMTTAKPFTVFIHDKDTSAADPFQETYKSALISTAHLTPATLGVLNRITASRDLPFWIYATEYGWIVWFEAVDAIGLIEEEHPAAYWIAQQADLLAIKAALFKHGYQAAHLDKDGPIIDGLEEYDH
jgi:uncharacterized membrane protein